MNKIANLGNIENTGSGQARTSNVELKLLLFNHFNVVYNH